MDEKRSIRSPIQLSGGFLGEIKPNIDSKSLLITNIADICDKSKLESETLLEGLVSDSFVMCEIRGLTLSEEVELHKIINSVICSISYHCNISLEFPEISLSEMRTTHLTSGVQLFASQNLEPLLYFNSAEKHEYSHIKFLEYYHVLEYYFLLENLNKIRTTIRNAVNEVLMRNVQVNDHAFSNSINDLHSIFLKDDFKKEINQLEHIVSQEIGFDGLRIILNELKPIVGSFEFLQKAIFDIEETKVTNLPKILTRQWNDFLPTIEEEDKKIFCKQISRRIYKIRNYIVHTKKDENKDVFVPTFNMFTKMKSDISFMRTLTYYLLSRQGIRL